MYKFIIKTTAGYVYAHETIASVFLYFSPLFVGLDRFTSENFTKTIIRLRLSREPWYEY